MREAGYVDIANARGEADAKQECCAKRKRTPTRSSRQKRQKDRCSCQCRQCHGTRSPSSSGRWSRLAASKGRQGTATRVSLRDCEELCCSKILHQRWVPQAWSTLFDLRPVCVVWPLKCCIEGPEGVLPPGSIRLGVELPHHLGESIACAPLASEVAKTGTDFGRIDAKPLRFACNIFIAPHPCK